MARCPLLARNSQVTCEFFYCATSSHCRLRFNYRHRHRALPCRGAGPAWAWARGGLARRRPVVGHFATPCGSSNGPPWCWRVDRVSSSRLRFSQLGSGDCVSNGGSGAGVRRLRRGFGIIIEVFRGLVRLVSPTAATIVGDRWCLRCAPRTSGSGAQGSVLVGFRFYSQWI